MMVCGAAWFASCGGGSSGKLPGGPPTHLIPTDLGMTCAHGFQAGCGASTEAPGDGCQDRCVSIGNWPSICTRYCVLDSDCGPTAHCVPIDSERGACMLMRGDPNVGCHANDGGSG